MRIPSYFDKYARNQWQKYAPVLRVCSDITDQDWAWLECYCTNYAIYRQSIEDINENGLFLMMNANQTRGQNPAFKVLTEAQKLMIKFGALLRDKLPIEASRDPLDDLME
jgi:P27 family predicted phage terminase small subunit